MKIRKLNIVMLFFGLCILVLSKGDVVQAWTAPGPYPEYIDAEVAKANGYSDLGYMKIKFWYKLPNSTEYVCKECTKDLGAFKDLAGYYDGPYNTESARARWEYIDPSRSFSVLKDMSTPLWRRSKPTSLWDYCKLEEFSNDVFNPNAVHISSNTSDSFNPNALAKKGNGTVDYSKEKDNFLSKVLSDYVTVFSETDDSTETFNLYFPIEKSDSNILNNGYITEYKDNGKGFTELETSLGITKNNWKEKVVNFVVDEVVTNVKGTILYYPDEDLFIKEYYMANYTEYGMKGGDSCGNPTTYSSKELPINLKSPQAKKGYSFDGWYRFVRPTRTEEGSWEVKLYNKVTSVDKVRNYMLVGKWSPINYTITLNLDSSAADVYINNIAYSREYKLGYTIETNNITLPTPTRKGYAFKGWFDAQGKEQKTIAKGSTGSISFKAKWVKVYTVSFNANGGFCNKTSVTLENGNTVGTLPIPTKSGYTFEGWYIGNTKVSEGYKPTGDITLVAKWAQRIGEVDKPKTTYTETNTDLVPAEDLLKDIKNNKNITKDQYKVIKGIIDSHTDNGMVSVSTIKSLIDSSTLPKDTKTKATATVTKSMVKPGKIKNLKVTVKKKKIVVSFKKQKKCTYQVQISTKKSMKKATTYKICKNKLTIKKLKSKKTYYVRVRAVSGRKGKWTKVKKVKVK